QTHRSWASELLPFHWLRRAGRHCCVRQTPCMRRPLINSLLTMTRIAPMSRRRAKCIVGIARGRSRFPISILAIQTIQTPQVGDTSPIQAPSSIVLGVAHAESDVPGCRCIQAVSSQAFTSEDLRTEVVAEGGDAQNRA